MKRVISSLLVLSSMSSIAIAEEGAWSGEGELGFTATSGNSETSTLTANLGINYKKNKLGNALKFGVLQAQTTDVTTGVDTDTADRYTLSNKTTYDFSDVIYGFFNANYTNDEFSGFEYQSIYTTGLGWKVVNNDTTRFSVELGAGFKRDELNSSEIQDGGAGRFFEELSHKFNDSTEFTHSIVSEGNSDNVLTVMENAIKVAASKKLSLKLGHQVKHNSDVENANNYDRITTASLIYGF